MKTFSSSFFINNRKALKDNCSSNAVILSANGLIQKSADQAFHFKQDTNFWYLTGINLPDVLLVITSKEEYLVIPKLDDNRINFDGDINYSDLSKISGIKNIYNEKIGWTKIKEEINKNQKVAALSPLPTRLKHLDFFTQPARRVLIQKLKRFNKNIEIEDIRPILARARMIKQDIEIEAIKKAIDITNSSLSEVLLSSNLNKYKYAYEIESAINYGFRIRGGSGHGFEPIIASGKNATVIHFSGHDHELVKNQLIVVDVGCEYSFYTADITRTVVYGSATKRQKEVYEAVKKVQKEAFKIIKPGILLKDLENKVEKLIGEQLIGLGLIKSLDKKAIRKYYPHSFSHSLGLDTHDSADYMMPLQKNMIITVEPGIYIPEESIGVRLEDDVLLTDNGIINLSSSLKTDLII